jgi:ABC-type uncharacterized transport system ATPase subunit
MQSAVQLNRVSKSFHVRRARGGGMTARARDLFRPLTETVQAIDGLSFSIAPGERVAFIGPNGAGESTTLKVLAGILRPLLVVGAAAYLALAVLVFNRGLRRYASGSRFSTFG